MKLLLTDSGVRNASILAALVDLLGKPTAEASALCIPTAGYGGHPLYSSKPGDAETLRPRRTRSIQTTEVNRHYFRNEASRFDPWGVADMIKCPVLILAVEDDPGCPLPIAEASASWG